MVSSAEFSFPPISTDLSQLAGTTSLWRISSKVKADFDEFDGISNGRRRFFSRSFCDIRDNYYYYETKKTDKFVDDEEYESMDLLWEDFNDDNHVEEYCESKSSSENCCVSVTEFELHEGKDMENGGQMVKDLKVFKTAKKHQRMALVLKAIKKLRLLGNMAKLKKREDF